MENKEITMANIILNTLSLFHEEGMKIMVGRIQAAIKTPEISELVNICIINANGGKSIIKECAVDTAVDGIIDFVHSEIDSSNLSEYEKSKEKKSYKCFAKKLGNILKEKLKETKQLVS